MAGTDIMSRYLGTMAAADSNKMPDSKHPILLGEGITDGGNVDCLSRWIVSNGRSPLSLTLNRSRNLTDSEEAAREAGEVISKGRCSRPTCGCRLYHILRLELAEFKYYDTIGP